MSGKQANKCNLKYLYSNKSSPVYLFVNCYLYPQGQGFILFYLLISRKCNHRYDMNSRGNIYLCIYRFRNFRSPNLLFPKFPVSQYSISQTLIDYPMNGFTGQSCMAYNTEMQAKLCYVYTSRSFVSTFVQLNGGEVFKGALFCHHG